MSQFVGKNRRLLSFCSRWIQACGWILLALWAVLTSSVVSQVVTSTGNPVSPLVLVMSIVSDLCPCLIILGIGQFIGFVLDREGKLSFLLNYSNVILFVYAALLAVKMVLEQIVIFEKLWPMSHAEMTWAKFLLVDLKAFLPDMVIIILLFTAGLLVKQAIGAIKKSKEMTTVEVQTTGA